MATASHVSEMWCKDAHVTVPVTENGSCNIKEAMTSAMPSEPYINYVLFITFSCSTTSLCSFLLRYCCCCNPTASASALSPGSTLFLISSRLAPPPVLT